MRHHPYLRAAVGSEDGEEECFPASASAVGAGAGASAGVRTSLASSTSGRPTGDVVPPMDGGGIRKARRGRAGELVGSGGEVVTWPEMSAGAIAGRREGFEDEDGNEDGDREDGAETKGSSNSTWARGGFCCCWSSPDDENPCGGGGDY